MMKIRCSTCKIEKNSSEFHNSRKLSESKSVRCKICANSATKKTYHKHLEKSRNKARNYRNFNPEAGRNAKFKSKYGITLDIYREMLVVQNSLCAICHLPETEKDGKAGRIKLLSVDHSHKTGKVRGLLCASCNKGLGLFEDSEQMLRSAAAYLDRFPECP